MKMVAPLALVLIVAAFGGLGFAVNVLWYVLIAAILLWLIGSSSARCLRPAGAAGTGAGSVP
jgi:hypothetical protein